MIHRQSGFIINRSPGFIIERPLGFIIDDPPGFIIDRPPGFIIERPPGFIIRPLGFIVHHQTTQFRYQTTRHHTVDYEGFVPLNSCMLRDQIVTASGPKVNCVEVK